ncbi:nuclear receptor-binding factor 2-like [Diorhabda sublineata]|uniref:nuclear receptor-binding factor 2-like n=1 Tax=Diorhabda sublineata TaxID=1163346 RepID=UPI0024E0A5F7|nr:nuclear receptor-binding factor 2-like [Diorhabda sublineata]
MDNSPLNKAHQEERRAEVFLRQKKYDECIECHKRSILLLEESCNLTTNKKALESIALQIGYNQKQIDLVLYKQAHSKMESLWKALQKTKTYGGMETVKDELDIEATISRTIEVHDSLIDYLGKRGGSDNDSVKSCSTSDNEEKLEKVKTEVIGFKRPKDDAQIIEEFKTLSGQLRDSVKCLLVQLDDRNKEIEKLKNTIRQLESEKEKAQQEKRKASLKVVTDSSGGTSPYIYSPCSELSPDIIYETRHLPPLAPLEMPDLNYLSTILRSPTNN